MKKLGLMPKMLKPNAKFGYFIVYFLLFSIFALASYIIYGIDCFGYDTPKYIVQLKMLKKHGLFLIVPESVRESAPLKFNYIYLYSIFAFFFSKIFQNISCSITSFSILVLVPLHGIVLFTLLNLVFKELLFGVYSGKRGFLVSLAAFLLSFLSIFDTSTAFLATHLFRQFFNTVLFEITLLFLIVMFKSNVARSGLVTLFVVIMVVLMFFNQIESALFLILYILFLAIYIRLFRLREYFQVSKLLIAGILAIVFIFLVAILLSIYFNASSQVLGIFYSSLRGFIYYSGRQQPMVLSALEHKRFIGIDILKGFSGVCLNLTILVMASVFFVFDTLMSKKHGKRVHYALLPLGVLSLLAFLTSIILPLPRIFQARLLLLYPWSLCYTIFGYYFLFQNKKYVNVRLLTSSLLLLFVLSLSLFNAVYSYANYIPIWSKPYVSRDVLNSIEVVSSICNESSIFIYIFYVPKYSKWEFSKAQLYKNWIYAKHECGSPLIYYGMLSDLIAGSNTLKHRRIRSDIYMEYKDVIDNFNKKNDFIVNNILYSYNISSFILILIKPWYNASDLNSPISKSSSLVRCEVYLNLKHLVIYKCVRKS